MAPLYNDGAIITSSDREAVDAVEERLTAEVAKTTLSTIDDILQTFEKPQKKRKKADKLQIPRRVCAKVGWPLFASLVTAGLVAAAISLILAQLTRCASRQCL